MTSVDDAKALIVDLCSTFYAQGWVSGTGGGISIKSSDGRIVMAPSGVQKERMLPSDMFVLDGASGAVVDEPAARPPPYRPPKLSECAPLFMAVSCFDCFGRFPSL
jgi:methylthioribulose 1-phosphate dehydratase / enolase-phosphatase E1